MVATKQCRSAGNCTGSDVRGNAVTDPAATGAALSEPSQQRGTEPCSHAGDRTVDA